MYVLLKISSYTRIMARILADPVYCLCHLSDADRTVLLDLSEPEPSVFPIALLAKSLEA
jgi:hypothetical protein